MQFSARVAFQAPDPLSKVTSSPMQKTDISLVRDPLRPRLEGSASGWPPGDRNLGACFQKVPAIGTDPLAKKRRRMQA